VRRLSSRILGINPADPKQPPRITSASPGIVDDASSYPPVRSPPAALLAPDRNHATSDWVRPLPFRSMTPPAQDAPGGLPGLMAQMGAFDPSNPDAPPAGGLVRLLREWMHNNPDSGMTPASSPQPPHRARSLAAPADGSADVDDAKNVRVLRSFIHAPDGSLI